MRQVDTRDVVDESSIQTVAYCRTSREKGTKGIATDGKSFLVDFVGGKIIRGYFSSSEICLRNGRTCLIADDVARSNRFQQTNRETRRLSTT